MTTIFERVKMRERLSEILFTIIVASIHLLTWMVWGYHVGYEDNCTTNYCNTINSEGFYQFWSKINKTIVSVVIINQFEFRNNITSQKSISNLTFEHTCDRKANCAVNCTTTTFITTLITTEKMTNASVRMPENSNDREYRKELIKTVVQLGRYLSKKSGNHNQLMTAFMRHIFDAIEFDPTMPLTPVSVKLFI